MANEFFDQFVDDLTALEQRIAEFSVSSNADGKSNTKDALKIIKFDANTELKAAAGNVAAMSPGPEREDAACNALRNMYRVFGFFQSEVVRLNERPFDIKEKLRHPGARICDFTILVNETPLPSSTGELKMQIDAVCSTVKSVMADRRSRIGYRNIIERTDAVNIAEEDYMEELVGIAKVGLLTTEPTRVAFARSDLERFKLYFTIREAGIVKNAYFDDLFRWCGLCSFLFIMLYIISRTQVFVPLLIPIAIHGSLTEFLYDTRNFHLFAAGAAIGTWLSFSLRRPEMKFEDLAVLEPDRLTPRARVSYTVGLAGFVALLLFSGAVVVGIGDVKGEAALHSHGSWSLMLGLLAGIAERALGKGVQDRSDALAAAIGGSGQGKTGKA